MEVNLKKTLFGHCVTHITGLNSTYPFNQLHKIISRNTWLIFLFLFVDMNKAQLPLPLLVCLDCNAIESIAIIGSVYTLTL